MAKSKWGGSANNVQRPAAAGIFNASVRGHQFRSPFGLDIVAAMTVPEDTINEWTIGLGGQRPKGKSWAKFMALLQRRSTFCKICDWICVGLGRTSGSRDWQKIWDSRKGQEVSQPLYPRISYFLNRKKTRKRKNAIPTECLNNKQKENPQMAGSKGRGFFKQPRGDGVHIFVGFVPLPLTAALVIVGAIELK